MKSNQQIKNYIQLLSPLPNKACKQILLIGYFDQIHLSDFSQLDSTQLKKGFFAIACTICAPQAARSAHKALLYGFTNGYQVCRSKNLTIWLCLWTMLFCLSFRFDQMTQRNRLRNQSQYQVAQHMPKTQPDDCKIKVICWCHQPFLVGQQILFFVSASVFILQVLCFPAVTNNWLNPNQI